MASFKGAHPPKTHFPCCSCIPLFSRFFAQSLCNGFYWLVGRLHVSKLGQNAVVVHEKQISQTPEKEAQGTKKAMEMGEFFVVFSRLNRS